MRKFLIFKDGTKYELSPITYKEYIYMDNWIGYSDSAYKYFLKKYNYANLDDFNEDALREAYIELVDDNGLVIDQNEYFVNTFNLSE